MSELYEQSEQDFCNFLSSINHKAENIQTQTKGMLFFNLISPIEKKEAGITEAQEEI
jgi:hypothetical protein